MKKCYLKNGAGSSFNCAVLIAVVLAFLLVPSRTLAQNRAPGDVSVNGTVRDNLGKPVPDVTVKVGGRNTVTSTDEKGSYSISVSLKGRIEFSRVGYKSQIIAVNNAVVRDVVLDANEGNENEVVVVGYGQQKKVSSIGAISTIRADELKQPVANITTLLAGRIAGIVGVQRSGQPGYDNAEIYIRGISTFTGSSPLVLVDGVERDFANADPEDIASFSIF